MCFLLLLAINNLRIIFASNSGEYITLVFNPT